MNKLTSKYNQIVFYDLEMMGEKENDIIAIGAVKCRSDLKIIGKFHSYIKPIGNRHISEFLSNLTGIKQCDIDNAGSFQKTLLNFFSWCEEKNTLFVSWGKQDYTQIFIDSKKNSIEQNELILWLSILKSNYTDFQKTFYNEVAPKSVSLEKSLKLYGASFVGDMHNPEYDALNLYILYLFYKKSFYKTKSLEIIKVSYNQNEKLKKYFEGMADVIYNIDFNFDNDDERLKDIIYYKYSDVVLRSQIIAAKEFNGDLIKTNSSNIKSIYENKIRDYIDALRKLKKKYICFTKLYRAESKEYSIIYNRYILYGIGRIDKLIILLKQISNEKNCDVAELCNHNIYNIKQNIEKKINNSFIYNSNTKKANHYEL